MARPVTLFTGQWADLTLEVICQKASQWGYDGIELPCWGDHFNVQKALKDDGYCKERHDLLGQYGLKCWAISNHLVGQLVLDVLDARTDDWVPAERPGQRREEARLGDPGDEGHRPGRPEAGREGRQRLHRLVDLAPALLVPAGLRRDDRRRLQAPGRALEPDPRRLQGVRRQVRPGGPPDRDRLRPLLGRDGPRRRWTTGPSSASTSTQPPALADGRPGRSSSGPSPTGSTTSTSRTPPGRSTASRASSART